MNYDHTLVCVVFIIGLLQGNYDAHIKTRSELEENQMKRYQWEKDQMQHMKVSQYTEFKINQISPPRQYLDLPMYVSPILDS